MPTNYIDKIITSDDTVYNLTVDLENVQNADDLKAIEGLTGTSGLLKKTASNTWTLDTSNYATTGNIPTASATVPKMDGTASVGSETAFARGDHIHPTDTSRLGGIILNTSAEPYNVPVSASGVATITVGDGLGVVENESGSTTTLKAKIKTINSTSLLGSGNVTVQPTLVSGTNIKTVNNESLLGSGNISFPTVPSASSADPLMDGTASSGSGTSYSLGNHRHPTDTSRQETLVSGTNIKTINNESLLGSGNITINSGTALTTQEIEDAVDAAFPVPFSVTISLTTPRHTGDFTRCDLYEAYVNGQTYDYVLLDSITDPAGSKTVDVDSSAYGIKVTPLGSCAPYIPSSGITCTGGLSVSPDTLSYEVLFAVTADGTATLANIDYDF